MTKTTAAQWMHANEISRNSKTGKAIATAVGQAAAYGKPYALSLWSGEDTTSRIVRDALKSLTLPWHGEVGNCA